MFLIILTGIFTVGLIPLLALFGFGINLIVNIFTICTWTYWEYVAVGTIFSLILGIKPICINIRKKREKENA